MFGVKTVTDLVLDQEGKFRAELDSLN